jgi:hypothetical protein
MTEIDLISKMLGKNPRQCAEYLLLFNMITGNTFFINGFPNIIYGAYLRRKPSKNGIRP